MKYIGPLVQFYLVVGPWDLCWTYVSIILHLIPVLGFLSIRHLLVCNIITHPQVLVYMVLMYTIDPMFLM